jgi:hypothetical protein
MGSSAPEDFPAPVSPSGSNETDSDEESIERYMERLLKRVNRPGDAAAPSPERPAVRSPAPPTNAKTIAQDEPPVEHRNSSTQPVAEPTRRVATPESRGDLLALREVANQSVRGAIDVHSHNRTLGAARGQLTTTLVSAAGAFVLLSMATPARQTLFMAAMTGVVTAIYFCGRFFWTTRVLSQFVAASQTSAPSPKKS